MAGATWVAGFTHLNTYARARKLFKIKANFNLEDCCSFLVMIKIGHEQRSYLYADVYMPHLVSDYLALVLRCPSSFQVFCNVCSHEAVRLLPARPKSLCGCAGTTARQFLNHETQKHIPPSSRY